jgi:hypothetical protein
MFWILQDNLYDERAFETLLEQLERQGTKYQVVKVIPFIGEMIPDVENVQDEHIMVLGATSMSKVAKRKGWVPGYFDDNLSYIELLKNYKGHMLNEGCIVAPFGAMKYEWDRFHLRPVTDSKSFAGTVFDWDEFQEWRDKIILMGEEENSLTTLSLNDLIVMSPLKKILAEYRFYVVDGKVVTGSLYKQGSRVIYKSDVDESVYAFAQEMVDIWAPNRAFALDIADTEEGYKVIEINSINSAGFYACDMGKFVAAINDMKFPGKHETYDLQKLRAGFIC